MILEPRDGLSPLGADLVTLIGRSDYFTALAASLLGDGLKSLDYAALEQEAQAGLGESLAVAYYKALVLLPGQPELLAAVTELLLHYRFLCALDGLVDTRSQAFWLRHGLDREIQESQRLHATARLSASGRVEHLCFGHQLASYFRMDFCMERQPDAQLLLSDRLPLYRLEPVVGDLWRFHSEDGRLHTDREVYLVVPHHCVSILSSQRLCELVRQIVPLLINLSGDSEAVICAPLGTRKVSISKQGMHSCSTYFDVGKPVPFSLNRVLEPYLIIAPDLLVNLSGLRSRQLFFAPLFDSLSTLVFRDPADYRLGEKAFLHQHLILPSSKSLISPVSPAMPADRSRCLMKGILLDASSANFSLSSCHHWADYYARCHGLYGHGPSGVMNQSVLITDDGVLTTWRYERNFDSWSGRCADVARHPSLNFLAWQCGAPSSVEASSELKVAPLTYSGYPSECKIEDLRLFSVKGMTYAISALILSRARYQQWMPEISAEAAANNTIDDMIVVQAFGRLDPARAVLEFECLPVLHPAADSELVLNVPTGFEKNWLICEHEAQLLLLYSIQPWRIFRAHQSLVDWRLMTECDLSLPRTIQGPLRNSAHPFRLDSTSGEQRLGLVVHRRRKNTYIYDQYLMVLSSDQLMPQKISRQPVLSVNTEALALDPGFRKNEGVCYVSSVLVREEVVFIYLNLFDCRTCVFTVSMADLLALIDDEMAFASLVP